MSPPALAQFDSVWCVDFEFHSPAGCRSDPICMVAREYRSGETLRLSTEELSDLDRPPFPIDEESLFVAYYASAELGCFLALDWPMPARVLDLFCEFRNWTNGLSTPCGNSLLGALTYFGLDAIEVVEKESMRNLAIRGGPFTHEERQALLAYCESDVIALLRLLEIMLPEIDLSRALLRGRYMTAAARIEWTGVPIDTDTLGRLRDHWTAIQGRLVAEVDRDYGVYVPTDRTINPDSTLGAEILRTAEDWEIDPYQLTDAVDAVWSQAKAARAEQAEALAGVRKATGLNAKRIADWEHSGRHAQGP